jgi:phage baseplate assembly protein W|tara:strand:+ start:966 stop:1367 length:402 start_codon:yes stop_codon:yes gene_type:complete
VPVERVSRSFKDLSMSFKANPLNDDLITLKNEAAIARSLRNIIFTSPGEKFFNPDFGSNISKVLFENIDEISAIQIKEEIELSIKNFEPRVRLQEVEINPDYDNNQFDVTINYRITGIDVPPQQLEFVLLPTR